MKLGVLVYIENEEKILMIHRHKDDEHKGLWLAPGGKIEKNEAPIEAAIREVEEETALVIAPPTLKGIVSFPDEGNSPFGDEWHVFIFYTNQFTGKLTLDCPEGELAWIAKDQIVHLPMWEGDKLFTPKIFENNKPPNEVSEYGRLPRGPDGRNAGPSAIRQHQTTPTCFHSKMKYDGEKLIEALFW